MVSHPELGSDLQLGLDLESGRDKNVQKGAGDAVSSCFVF